MISTINLRSPHAHTYIIGVCMHTHMCPHIKRHANTHMKNEGKVSS